MATRKIKVFRTEADIGASIDEEFANDSDDENYISDSGLGPSVDGFCKKDHQPSIPLFTGNPAVQFAVQNETDMMEYEVCPKRI